MQLTSTPSFDAGLAPVVDVAADEASSSLQPSATLPPEPSHATSAVPVASSSKTPFRSWAEDYAPQRDWKYDRQAVRIAKAMRAQAIGQRNRAERGEARNHRDHLSNQQQLRHDAELRRQADPFERVKAFLQRRMPVYAADIAGGDKGQFVVGTRVLTRDDLVALAKAKGWQG